jgi:hypothetical protein
MMSMRKICVRVVSVESEYAWCAGFFDGEGSTTVLKAQRDKYSYIRMNLPQKDNRVLEKFHSIMKVGNIYKSKTRDIFSLDIYKHEDVMDTLNKMWPYLSEIKKEQAINALHRVITHKEIKHV